MLTDHEVYGVIEPDQEKIKPGMTGIGQLIEIRDAAGSKLARLIIGKEDKQSGVGGGSRRLRFVRKGRSRPCVSGRDSIPQSLQHGLATGLKKTC